MADAHVVAPLRAALAFIVLMAMAAPAAAQDMHAAIQSTRGVQHKLPLISDDVVIGAIMQHIEQAGVHSGDSACSLPPYSLPQDVQEAMRDVVRKMALELGVCGLMNVQLAWQDNEIYVIEVNPRASRTVPFVSKAVGVSLAKVAARSKLR